MTTAELIPIGTFIGMLTDEVFDTYRAAKDVFKEKGMFKTLPTYLYDIQLVLEQLRDRELNDTQAARQALEFLKKNVKKAKHIVDKYKNYSRIYLLVRCRNIVKEIHDVTRDIGSSLDALSLATAGVLSDISDQVNRLHGNMEKAEFEASQAHLRILERLDQGIRERKTDMSFANTMLEEIAKALGLPVEPSEINEELASLMKEKEEAAARKERAEEIFIEQVIELLSHADAAISQEEINSQYQSRVQTLDDFSPQGVYIPPFKPFICPITNKVMVDPVNLCTGTTCERTAIEEWLKNGQTTDPVTGQVLGEFTLKSNIGLRKSIEEWRELNYCLKIRSAKENLLSDDGSAGADALDQLQAVINGSPINKDWIAIEGLIDVIISKVESSHENDFKRRALVTLTAIVEGHDRNKERVVESGGIDQIIVCLGNSPDVSEVAVQLLFELMQGGSGWKDSLCRKLKQQDNAIFYLVLLLHSSVAESAGKAEAILEKLCDDDDTIQCAAAHNWYKPLIHRLCLGREPSRISMARVLVKMDLIDRNIRLLGEEGIIPPLVNMASGNIESKDTALSALAKLLSCLDNKRLVAAAGGVPLIIEDIFSPHVPQTTIAKCCEILQRLTSDSGIEFLVDENGLPLELEPIITNLMAVLQEAKFSPSIRKSILYVLLSICNSEEMLAKKALAATNGVSILLPLLEDSDLEIRELAIKLINLFSQHEPNGIAEFLLDNRLEPFVGFLKDDSQESVQLAALGLLAHLPKSNVAFTNGLVELNVLPVLMDILKTGTTEAKESVLGALFRFTDPENIKMQQQVVKLEIYPLLLSILRSGSTTAKARAVALIGNLSLSSSKLSAAPVRTSCWCFLAAPPPVCEVHAGMCDVTTTFCLLKADALPLLVKLLQEREQATALGTLQALRTLVQDETSPQGAKVLHKASAIPPILDVLGWGSSTLVGEALLILEKVFKVSEVAKFYSATARNPIVKLLIQNNENRQRAMRVVEELDRYSQSGSMLN